MDLSRFALAKCPDEDVWLFDRDCGYATIADMLKHGWKLVPIFGRFMPLYCGNGRSADRDKFEY